MNKIILSIIVYIIIAIPSFIIVISLCKTAKKADEIEQELFIKTYNNKIKQENID